MAINLTDPVFTDENKARAHLEAIRWPHGPVCPHCGNADKKRIYDIAANPAKKIRAGLRECGECGEQFTVQTGSVMESSHVPLNKWVLAYRLMASAKKGISAHQMHRTIGVTYKTAWFMCHRIRFAFDGDTTKLKGTVEADETFVGGEGDRKTQFSRKTPVVALIERGGKMVTRVVTNVSQRNLGQVLNECVDKSAIVNTDDHDAYKPALKEFKRHDVVTHSRNEYHRKNPDGTISTTNSAESFFSLLRRGVYGSWHHVSREHLSKYSSEFAFRWNHRHITDGARMAAAVPMMQGKRLTYRQAV